MHRHDRRWLDEDAWKLPEQQLAVILFKLTIYYEVIFAKLLVSTILPQLAGLDATKHEQRTVPSSSLD